MSQTTEQDAIWSLRESLFMGFCAVFIILTRAALRIHLGIPGHNMFFAVFFLFLARGCTSHRFAATVTGFLAGIMAVILGLGKGGPLILLKFLLPGLAIDIGALLIPMLFGSYLFCGLVAAVAAGTKMLETYIVDYLVGMDADIILQHVLLQTASNMLFGVAGGLLVPSVIRKLKAYGVI